RVANVDPPAQRGSNASIWSLATIGSNSSIRWPGRDKCALASTGGKSLDRLSALERTQFSRVRRRGRRRWLDRGPVDAARNPAPGTGAQVVQVRVDHRRDVEREKLGEHQAASDAEPER